MGKKFHEGDRVIGNTLADAWYGITTKGWTGIVIRTAIKSTTSGQRTMCVRSLKGGPSFWVRPEAFDLLEGCSTVAPSTTEKSVLPGIKKVIFNAPATIVFWDDGTKTVVKCQPGKNGKLEKYDKEKGLAMCITKKALGNQSNFNNVINALLKEE